MRETRQTAGSLPRLWISAPPVARKSRLPGMLAAKAASEFAEKKISSSAIFWGFTREARQTPRKKVSRYGFVI
ncbi:MAG: hypothetical protein LBT87_02130 [Treponema sp.]|nr:hypothetical protein [Treponema sp.]